MSIGRNARRARCERVPRVVAESRMQSAGADEPSSNGCKCQEWPQCCSYVERSFSARQMR